jgi:DNA polymerase
VDDAIKNELVTDCLAALEYLSDLGLAELCPPPSPVLKRPKDRTDAIGSQRSSSEFSRNAQEEGVNYSGVGFYPGSGAKSRTQGISEYSLPESYQANEAASADRTAGIMENYRNTLSSDSNPLNSARAGFPGSQIDGQKDGQTDGQIDGWAGGKAAGSSVSQWLAKIDNLSDLSQAVSQCSGCFLRKNTVTPLLGRGPVAAPIMFIVEPPTFKAPALGCAPGSATLELLENIITMGLKLKTEQCYITSIVRCPVEDPQNLKLNISKSCTQITFKEIELVKPKAILAFGIAASQALCSKEDIMFRLRRLKTTLTPGKIPFRMTLGLSDMLTDPGLKKDVWSDLKAMMGTIL